MDAILTGFLGVITSPMCWLCIILGVIIGIIFGAVPGLTATTAIAMFLPLTYAMEITPSLSLLIALYIGGISGGLISAILLNMPGTPSSIATCFDGRPMALKGQGGKALGVGVVFSFIGTIVGILVLVVVAAPLAQLTIKFGPWEYFAVTFFSLSLIAGLSGKDIIKGLMCAVVGMMFATVGTDPIDGVMRFTFDTVALTGGFQQMTVLIGMYAISEVLDTASLMQADKDAKVEGDVHIKGVGFSLSEFKSQIWNCIRSALIGVGIGILPGIGGGTSNILAYSTAKNGSKHPEKFGTGIIDGVVASETANNATIGGAMIPLLTLGIPGDAVTALLLGGFIMNGVQPGPLIFTSHADVVYCVYAAMMLASIVMLVCMLGGMRFFVRVLKVPKNYLLPMIMILCMVGAFALNNRIFDVGALIFFGVIGYLLQKFNFPLPPLILGFVLGGTFETNLRRGLQVSNGSFLGMFQSPIAMTFVVIGVASIIFTLVRQTRKKA
jgi:putative tricarboxylic transport membrane protein